MKRCGQWFHLLWIAAALLYPQAVTAASCVRDDAAEITSSSVRALPLIADLSHKESANPEGQPEETTGDSPTLSPEARHRLTPSDDEPHRFVVAANAQMPEVTPGRLPPGRAPPVRS